VRPAEVRELLQVRVPPLSRADRVLERCVTVADLRAAALRRWPKGVRDYAEGGADGEISLARNRAAYSSYEFLPSTLVDVSEVHTSTQLLGRRSELPFAFAPTGYTRMMHADGEAGAALAARGAGIPYTLSTRATTSIEDVARQAPGGDLWFQLYIWRDRALIADLLARAAESGYRALLLTVDTAVIGLRARDHHSGFTMPPQLTPATLLDMALHPGWCVDMLRGTPIRFANFAPEVSDTPEDIGSFASRQFDPGVTWDDVAAIRDLWQGPLVLKGIASPDDARQAIDVGAQAVVLSNHGGRQLDQSVAPIDMVVPVRDVVGDGLSVLVDSGVRRGGDIAIALALGADGVLIGRPYLYGLGAAGRRGAAAAIDMLAGELRRTMSLLGVCSVAELQERGPGLVRRSAVSPQAVPGPH
jgi:L-lactate dehydrogenase (cytochrome)